VGINTYIFPKNVRLPALDHTESGRSWQLFSVLLEKIIVNSKVQLTRLRSASFV